MDKSRDSIMESNSEKNKLCEMVLKSNSSETRIFFAIIFNFFKALLEFSNLL